MFKWLKKIFIPHEHNEFRPHVLRHETVFAFLLFIIILELGFLVQVFIVFDKTKFLAAVLPGVLTALTNEERRDLNLPPLTENELLKQAATLKAEDMAKNGYFAHVSPEGKDPWYWLKEVGYVYHYAGENLAVNFFESNDVAQAWMDSPTHKANIVKPDYTEIGIGIASGVYKGRQTVFVAQFFGTPLAYAETPNVTPAPTPVRSTQTEVAKTELVTAKSTPTIPTPKPEPALIEIAGINPVETIILGEEAIAQTKTPAPQKNSTLISRTMRLLSSPLTSTTYAFALVALVIVFALLMVLFVRSELAHPVMVAKGFALLSVIVFLLLMNVKVFYVRTVVPENATANVIQIEFAP